MSHTVRRVQALINGGNLNAVFNTLSVDNEGFQTGDAIDSVDLQGTSRNVRTKIEQDGLGNTVEFMCIKHVDNVNASPSLYTLRSRGSKASPSIVQNNDEVGYWATAAYDGSEYRVTSVIHVKINDSSPSVGSISSDLIFNVSTGSSYEEVLRLDKDKVGDFSSRIKAGVNEETLSANKTLARTDVQTQVLNPNGSDRDVTLYASPVEGDYHVIVNDGTANILTVKNNGGTTITTVAINVSVAVVYTGTKWVLV